MAWIFTQTIVIIAFFNATEAMLARNIRICKCDCWIFGGKKEENARVNVFLQESRTSRGVLAGWENSVLSER